MNRRVADLRSDYRHFHAITTRWGDNDVYGHVNNVLYYSWFDTVVNQMLISHSVLDIEHGPVIALVIETGCNFLSSVAFPDRVTAGLRVATIGRSSIRYEVGIFREDEEQAAAQGHLVHVCVERTGRRPTPIPDAMRTVLATLQVTTISP